MSHGRAARLPRDPSLPRRPREGTKHQAVLSLLRREEGATIAQVVEAAGWAQHTVRGFFAGLMAGSRLSQASTQPRYAVGLCRVSTAEQGHSGLGLEAQQARVRAFIERKGWLLVAEHQDIASGKDDRRPGFQAALTRCRQLGAVLVAARLDRITRRAHTLSQLLEEGISMRPADMPGADDLMMRVYAAMAQKERELISERTRAALAAARTGGGAGREQGMEANIAALCLSRGPGTPREGHPHRVSASAGGGRTQKGRGSAPRPRWRGH
ncbi:recombinase family protein [Roseomonas populi]|uniref:recombinase family protein n=1 Tax=Roseomonas populi TaxID=3121582 RepID=UPI0038CD157C